MNSLDKADVDFLELALDLILKDRKGIDKSNVSSIRGMFDNNVSLPNNLILDIFTMKPREKKFILIERWSIANDKRTEETQRTFILGVVGSRHSR
jgi:hypothetical protein